MFFELLLSSGEAASALAAIFGILWAVWKFILKPILTKFATEIGEFLAKIDAIPTLTDRVSKLAEFVNTVDVDRLNKEISDLKTQSSLYRQIQEFSILDQKVATFISNKEGDLIHVNPEFTRLTGRSKDECMGLQWVNFIEENIRDQVIANWQNSVRDERDWMAPLIKIELPSGELVDIRMMAYVLSDVNGDFNGHFGFARRIERRSEQGKR